jgi:hypothetical protein
MLSEEEAVGEKTFLVFLSDALNMELSSAPNFQLRI